MEIPETRYAKTADGVHIAYQVAGEGAVDLVVVASVLGLGEIWRGRRSGQFLRRLASFSRLILLDWRGTGLSDHVIDRMQQLSLENRMEDVRAVRNAIGSSRAVLLSAGEEQRACPPVSLIRSEWAVPRIASAVDLVDEDRTEGDLIDLSTELNGERDGRRRAGSVHLGQRGRDHREVRHGYQPLSVKSGARAMTFSDQQVGQPRCRSDPLHVGSLERVPDQDVVCCLDRCDERGLEIAGQQDVLSCTGVLDGGDH